jgi:DNA polymerase-3 subunit delta'
MTVTVPPRQNPFLFGHEATLKRLLDTHKQGRLHHSLIFVGPQGVGKETLAYHFMRAILQDDAKVFAGSHPHIFVMQPIYDEKKGRFKRDITKGALEGLTEFLRLVPQDDKPRFILINPADGMNNDTQNALLKVLEEPPAQTFFILLATHVASILPTIRSRCLIVSVEPMGAKDFEKSLQHYMPQADFDKVASYQQVAQGVLGTVLRYEEEEILGLYDRFCQTCLEWREEKNSIPAMQMAEEFAPQDNEETANALIDLFLQRLSAFIKNASRAQATAPIAASEGQLFAYWQNVSPQKLLQEYDRLYHVWQEGIDRYLDRKMVLLSFLRIVAGMDSAKAAVI